MSWQQASMAGATHVRSEVRQEQTFVGMTRRAAFDTCIFSQAGAASQSVSTIESTIGVSFVHCTVHHSDPVCTTSNVVYDRCGLKLLARTSLFGNFGGSEEETNGLDFLLVIREVSLRKYDAPSCCFGGRDAAGTAEDAFGWFLTFLLRPRKKRRRPTRIK
jgi:hypothetical protein